MTETQIACVRSGGLHSQSEPPQRRQQMQVTRRWRAPELVRSSQEECFPLPPRRPAVRMFPFRRCGAVFLFVIMVNPTDLLLAGSAAWSVGSVYAG